MELKTLLADYPRAVRTNAAEWPKTFKCRFIQPGLVHYEDMGTVLVDRPALNKMAQTFVGKPVIDEVHKDAKPENFKDIADGVVIRVWTDPTDGWDWCEFLVWDEETMRHCKSREYSVSCAYTPSQVNDKGGVHNNMPYDGEFLDGVYTHLAIVKDPRYERAKIVMNSKGGSMFKLFSRKAEEVDGKSVILEVEGKEYTIENVAEIIRKSNATPIADDQVVEVEGKEYTGRELKRLVLNAKKKMENEKPEHDHDEEDNCGKGCPAYSSKNAQEKGEKAGDQEKEVEEEKKEGKKEDKGEAKNAEEEEEEKEKKKAENALKPLRAAKLDAETMASVVNSLAKKEEYQHPAAQQVFEDVLNALDMPTKEKGKHLSEFAAIAEMRNNDPAMPTVNTMTDRLALGKARYGAIKKEAA